MGKKTLYFLLFVVFIGWIVSDHRPDSTTTELASSATTGGDIDKDRQRQAEREARANENARRREEERKKKKEAAAQALAEMPEDLRQEQITKELARKMALERGDPEPGSCRDDLKCWGETNQLHASSACAKIVERMANYSHEWTDGWLGSKFTHYRWANKKAGIITHMGDSIKFQNGFGAWQNMRYECDFNPQTKAVLDVRVSPGRM